MIEPVNITASTVVSAFGAGTRVLAEGLRRDTTPLQRAGFCDVDLPVGEVPGADDVVLGPSWRRYDCRNNRLAELALTTDGFADRVFRAKRRYGAARIGVFIGTSTSGMLETEQAFRALTDARDTLPADFRYRERHRVSAPVDFVTDRLGLTGHAVAISTACSSSAKVFAASVRSLRLGLCDAAVVGGVDSLCRTTLYGFMSLQLTSGEPCRPFAVDRAGLCIGEAAGFALLEPSTAADTPALLGYGESSDAHHMSTPHPEAAGARLTIRRALECAAVAPDVVDYVNLHGTATRVNDAVEDHAVTKELGDRVACSSTKGWTGHTLGAAGILEALICLTVLDSGHLPHTQNTERVDPAFSANVITRALDRRANLVLSNSFGFGGSNCSLVFGRR